MEGGRGYGIDNGIDRKVVNCVFNSSWHALLSSFPTFAFFLRSRDERQKKKRKRKKKEPR